MHAPVWKRTNSSQIIGLALILGLAASVTLNVVMLTRSDENQVASNSTQAHAELLTMPQRFYIAKDARHGAVERVAGAQLAPIRALTASQQGYFDRKSDQMDGIAAQADASNTRDASQQRNVDLKSDQMDGIAPGQ